MFPPSVTTATLSTTPAAAPSHVSSSSGPQQAVTCHENILDFTGYNFYRELKEFDLSQGKIYMDFRSNQESVSKLQDLLSNLKVIHSQGKHAIVSALARFKETCGFLPPFDLLGLANLYENDGPLDAFLILMLCPLRHSTGTKNESLTGKYHRHVLDIVFQTMPVDGKKRIILFIDIVWYCCLLFKTSEDNDECFPENAKLPPVQSKAFSRLLFEITLELLRISGVSVKVIHAYGVPVKDALGLVDSFESSDPFQRSTSTIACLANVRIYWSYHTSFFLQRFQNFKSMLLGGLLADSKLRGKKLDVKKGTYSDVVCVSNLVRMMFEDLYPLVMWFDESSAVDNLERVWHWIMLNDLERFGSLLKAGSPLSELLQVFQGTNNECHRVLTSVHKFSKNVVMPMDEKTPTKQKENLLKSIQLVKVQNDIIRTEGIPRDVKAGGKLKVVETTLVEGVGETFMHRKERMILIGNALSKLQDRMINSFIQVPGLIRTLERICDSLDLNSGVKGWVSGMALFQTGSKTVKGSITGVYEVFFVVADRLVLPIAKRLLNGGTLAPKNQSTLLAYEFLLEKEVILINLDCLLDRHVQKDFDF